MWLDNLDLILSTVLSWLKIYARSELIGKNILII